MNAGDKRIILGVGVSLALGALVHYLYRARQSRAEPSDMPREDGYLSSSSLVRLIEEIKHLCQSKLVMCTQKELRVACAEDRQHVRHVPSRYEEVVLSYLTREREALHNATAEVLAKHHVSKELFEASLQRNVQLDEAAKELSHSLTIGLDGLTQAVPEGLTLDVYNQVMTAFESLLTTAVKQYKGEVPIPPFSLVLMFMRVYDELRAKFHYSEFELAAAGEVYAKGQTMDLQSRLQLITGSVAGRQGRGSK